MSFFKRQLKPGRRNSDDDPGDPGRPSRRIRTTDAVTPSENIVRYTEKPRLNGRVSAGRTREEATVAMITRGQEVKPKSPRAEDQRFRLSSRSGPSPAPDFGPAPMTTRDRDLEKE